MQNEWVLRDLLYNIVPIDNNAVLCTVKYVKRIALMVSVLITHTHTHKESFKGGGYVLYLACSDGIRGIYICPNSSKLRH